ncbi:MAG: hypothetical protein LBP59_09535 [Planctomycetaceae bacterium]|nr:hypothetical protein [Planctomycetaceae bacterium]
MLSLTGQIFIVTKITPLPPYPLTPYPLSPTPYFLPPTSYPLLPTPYTLKSFA